MTTAVTPYLSMRQRDLRCLLAEIGTCVGQDTRKVPEGKTLLLLWFEAENRDPQRVAVEIWPDGSLSWNLTPRGAAACSP